MKTPHYTILLLLVATLHCSGQTWKPIPVSRGYGSVIRSDPHRPGMVYIAYRGVIVGTSDGGDTWLYKSFSHYVDALPRDLHIDVANADRWYLAMGASGFMRSTDAGLSWEYRNSGLALSYHNEHKQVVQDKSDPHILYLLSDGPVYKSTDRGESWRTMLNEYTTRRSDYAESIVINHRNSDSIYVFGRKPVKRYVSGDKGETWSPDSSYLGRVGTLTHLDNGDLLVGSWVSRDYGKTWTNYPEHNVPARWPPPDHVTQDYKTVYDAARDRYIVAHPVGLLSRTSSETTWSGMFPDSLYDEHNKGFCNYLHYDAGSGTVWALSPYRVWRIRLDTDTPKYFENGPYLPTSGYLITHDVRGGMILSGTCATLDNGATWRVLPYESGPGQPHPPRGAVSPVDSMFIVRGAMVLSYSTTGFMEVEAWRISKAMNGVLLTGHIHFNPHNPDEIFAGDISGLFRITKDELKNRVYSDDSVPFAYHIVPKDEHGRPESWFHYSAMDFHPTLDGVYYLCTTFDQTFPERRYGLLHMTTDRGLTWITLLDEADQYFYDIRVNPIDPDIIVIASMRGLLRSTDGGRNWTRNMKPPFSFAVLTSLLIDPRSPNVYYCGGWSAVGPTPHRDTGLRSGGMYVSYDFGETWEALPLDGMHNVSVRAIHYHENPRRLIVSTYAGIYEMLLPEAVVSARPASEKAPQRLEVYPNPAIPGQTQHIAIDGFDGRHVVVDLYSIHGRRIARVHEGAPQPGVAIRYRLASLPPGMYYYRVLGDGRQYSLPFIVTH